MKLMIFRSVWGMAGMPDELVARIAEAGYDGVEGIPAGVTPQEFSRLLSDHGLHCIAGIYPSAASDVRGALQQVAAYEPMLITSHSGRDCMTRDEGCRFFEEALRAEAEIGIPVAHETHRGRLFYTPWDTAFFLTQFPEIRVNADFSHWVNVCERLPDDQQEALDLACRRSIHIHGRVGYEEGPQVPHPGAPEYQRHLEWHERQWQRIRAYHAEDGKATLTFTPEYGPPDYLHTLPYTAVPVADLWQVCLWQAERARQLFADQAV